MVQRSIFSEVGLANVVRAGDSDRFGVDLLGGRQAIIAAASTNALAGNVTLTGHSRANVRGKPCVSYRDYETNLVLRAVAKYLSRRFRVVSPNRDRIVKGVIEGLMDTTPMYVIRRDVTSFYESIPFAELRDRLLFDTSIPRLVRHYLREFFTEHCRAERCGLPRGVGLTAVLVELAMEQFDIGVRAIPGVYRYFRYSDDILVFAFSDPVRVAAGIDSLLPAGMVFGREKSSVTSFALPKKPPAQLVSFEYLGYCYTANPRAGGDTPREVEVTISPRKIKRLKSRIVLALKDHRRRPDAQLLIDRLRFISGNHRIHRRGVTHLRDSIYVKSGIYYNYKSCGVYSEGSFTERVPPELHSLDNFLHSTLRSPGGGFSGLLRATLAPAQQARLRQLSFSKGFEARLFVRMPYQRFGQVKAVWRHV